MKLEKFNYNSDKRSIWFLYGFILAVVLMVLINLFFSEAKYLNTESIKIVEGTIKSYSPYDFKLLAVKLENENGEYESSDTIPTNGYTLNTTESYCTIPSENGNEVKDNSIIINYHDGVISFDNIVIRNTKCYLYFDQYLYSQIVNYTVLYDYGNEYEEITGGWKDGSVYESNLSTSSAGVQTANSLDINGYNGIAFISSLTKHSGRENSIDLRIKVDSQITANMNSGLFFIYGEKNPYSMQYDVFILDSPLISESNKSFQVFLRTNAYASTSRSVQKNEDNISINAYYDVYQNFTLNMYMVVILKPDDWSTLGSIAGITVPLTLEEFVDDSSALETIMNNKDAVNFMIMQCTGDFMASAVQSSTFRNILNNSPYKDLVYANEHWAKFLSMIE